MQIVIEISDSLYSKLIDMNSDSDTCSFNESTLVESIQHGTPLPKNHGRFIDADELLISERPKGIADDVWKESHIYKLLSDAPTIIEADKAESEVKINNG